MEGTEQIEIPLTVTEGVAPAEGIKILAKARAIRWMGWGFGEALIPVFIAQFASSFTQMGFVSSILELVSIASLPLIGLLADRTPSKRLILLSLLLYPLVGLSY